MPEPNEQTATPLVKYSPAEAEIKIVSEEVTAALATVPPEAPERLDLLKTCHAKARDLRLAVEARRIELNEHPLELTRQINAKAKQLQALIATIEEPIKRERKAIEDSREAAARAIVEATEKERKAAEEAERKAVQDKIDAERAALAAERAEMDRARAASMAALKAEIEATEKERRARAAEADRQVQEQRQQLAAERAKLDEAAKVVREAEERIAQVKRAEQEAQERAAWEAMAKEQAEARAIAVIEQQRRDNERLRKEQGEEQARIEAARPDVEKIRRFGKQIRDLAESAPELSSQALQLVVTDAHAQLMLLANTLEKFQAAKKPRKVAQPTP